MHTYSLQKTTKHHHKTKPNQKRTPKPQNNKITQQSTHDCKVPASSVNRWCLFLILRVSGLFQPYTGLHAFLNTF